MTIILHATLSALLAALAIPLGLPAQNAPAPAATLSKLLEGNSRFAEDGQSSAQRQPLVTGQKPVAAVLACADSRVAPEIVFDQGLGQIFVVRTAGIIADEVALGSLEYGIEHLGARLLIVLGHQSCGAVQAGLAALGGESFPGNIQAVVDAIVPGLETVPSGRRTVEAGVGAGILHRLRSILSDSEAIRHLVAAQELHLVGARYDLDSGRIEVVVPAAATQAIADAMPKQVDHDEAGPAPAHQAHQVTHFPDSPAVGGALAPRDHRTPSASAPPAAAPTSSSSLHVEGLIALGVLIAAACYLARLRVNATSFVWRPTVGTRTLGIVLVCAGSTYLVGDQSLKHIQSADDEVLHIEHEDLPRIETAFRTLQVVDDYVETLQVTVAGAQHDGGKELAASRAALETLLLHMEAAHDGSRPSESDLPERIQALLQVGAAIESDLLANHKREAAGRFQQLRSTENAISESAGRQLADAQATVAGRVAAMSKEAAMAATEVEELFGVSLLVGLTFSVWLSLWIRRSLNAVCIQAQALQVGDLSRDLAVGRTWDEFAVMRAAFHEMAQRWRGIVTNVRSATSHLSSASDQLSASSQGIARTSTDVSGLVQQQAAALEEVQAALQQIQETAFKVAEDADSAGRTAQETNSQAEKAMQSMDSVRVAMSDIDKSGKAVQRVIETVQGLAHQTNLLALNAAVEAARAGDVGRGFAVVAEEVRNLAARTQESSKEITQLVESAGERSAAGCARTQDAAESFTHVAKGIGATAVLSSTLAAAVEEQTSILKEIGTTLRSVSDGTQRSASNSQDLAATAEQLAATSEECSAQSRALVELVGFFRLEAETRS